MILLIFRINDIVFIIYPFFIIIINRLYCDYYKIYKSIKKFVETNYKDIPIIESKFTVYKDLDIEKIYYFQEIIQLQNVIHQYIKNHHIIYKLIPTNKYESYVRDIIRKDNQLVISCLMRENFKRWTSYKKYLYKNIIY